MPNKAGKIAPCLRHCAGLAMPRLLPGVLGWVFLLEQPSLLVTTYDKKYLVIAILSWHTSFKNKDINLCFSIRIKHN